MIERQKIKYGWEFLFLGANIDAVETASLFGIDEDRAVNYQCDSEGTALNYEVISRQSVLSDVVYHWVQTGKSALTRILKNVAIVSK